MAPDWGLLLVSLMCFISLCLTTDSSDGHNTCEDICSSTVNHSQDVDNVGYCTRGCRLMRLVDFANDGEGNLDDLLQMCLHSCNSAYDDTYSTAVTACQSGCQSQLPAVKARRQQLAMFYDQAEQYVQMIEWANSVMSCFRNGLQSDLSSQTSHRGYYVRARIVVISSSDEDGSPLSRSVYGHAAAMVNEPERSSGSQDSWLDCLSDGSGLSRHALMMMFGVTFFMLTLFTLGVCCPSCFSSKPDYSHAQKLSIYGDGESLKTLDDDNDEELLIDMKGSVDEPRLILMKIPIHSV